jgi:hypothetical protein
MVAKRMAKPFHRVIGERSPLASHGLLGSMTLRLGQLGSRNAKCNPSRTDIIT